MIKGGFDSFLILLYRIWIVTFTYNLNDENKVFYSEFQVFTFNYWLKIIVVEVEFFKVH